MIKSQSTKAIGLLSDYKAKPNWKKYLQCLNLLYTYIISKNATTFQHRS